MAGVPLTNPAIMQSHSSLAAAAAATVTSTMASSVESLKSSPTSSSASPPRFSPVPFESKLSQSTINQTESSSTPSPRLTWIVHRIILVLFFLFLACSRIASKLEIESTRHLNELNDQRSHFESLLCWRKLLKSLFSFLTIHNTTYQKIICNKEFQLIIND